MNFVKYFVVFLFISQLTPSAFAIEKLSDYVGFWKANADTEMSVKNAVMSFSMSGTNLVVAFRDDTKIPNSPCSAKAGDILFTAGPQVDYAQTHKAVVNFYDSANNCALTNITQDIRYPEFPITLSDQTPTIINGYIQFTTLKGVIFTKISGNGSKLTKSFKPQKVNTVIAGKNVSVYSTEVSGAAKYVFEIVKAGKSKVSKSKKPYGFFSNLSAGKYSSTVSIEFKDAKGKQAITKKSSPVSFSIK